eukprot:CAMPEP_0113888746 /NCGR_PEP_ID=MMETSP0780_2-20120614/13056_1 /TAXON_ID=652834 /ORGANISM="Palpitomonas bilix" /LENGTH=414 /DNA_ID=CAMNT_0000877655 /DNA_START=213 /DNA_END=1457 /DNA_ORIENTATION=- /assembly_acc=CAM_ASM_000599
MTEREGQRNLNSASTSSRDAMGTRTAAAASSFSSSVPRWVHFSAGGVGGTIGAVATCPLEVVKTRLQSTNHTLTTSARMPRASIPSFGSRLLSPVFAVKSIAKEEGVRGLFRGVDTLIVGVAPTRAIYFFTYSAMKVELARLGAGDGPMAHLGSACIAGFVTCTAINPLHFVRTRLQLQYESFKKGSERELAKGKDALWVIKTVYKEEGIRGFYKGLAASYLGIIENVIQFTLYEFFKKGLAERKQMGSGDGSSRGGMIRSGVEEEAPEEFVSSAGEGRDKVTAAKTVNQNLSHWDTVTASVGAKVIAAVIAYPHEVLRTRMRELGDSTSSKQLHAQRARDGIAAVSGGRVTGAGNAIKEGVSIAGMVRHIYRTEGLGGLYAGLGISLVKSIPNTAIMFVVYEAIVKWAESTYG